jgi:hypothetical protein
MYYLNVLVAAALISIYSPYLAIEPSSTDIAFYLAYSSNTPYFITNSEASSRYAITHLPLHLSCLYIVDVIVGSVETIHFLR